MNNTEQMLYLMVVPMTAWLGREGMAYFQGMIDGNGNLIPANSMILGHGMSVRNKMRELMGYPDESTLPEHFYDDNWQRLIGMCLKAEHQRNCKICGGMGVVRAPIMGELHPPLTTCVCRKEKGHDQH